MAIAIPMLLLLLFGYALTLDVDNVPIVIWDQDKTEVSRDYILKFESSRYFKIVRYADNYRQIQDAIDKNLALVAIVIPTKFSKYLTTGQSAAVQVILEGSDSNTATIAMGYISALSFQYNQKLADNIMKRKSTVAKPASIDMRTRVWFNPELKSKNYIIPGLIAVIMMVIASLLTSLTVAKEWESGTMEQLISTPIQANELIVGKLIPYFLIGLVDVVVAVAMGQFLFHVPLRGNVALLFILSGLFLTGALSLGLLISIITKTQLLASQIAMITTFLPAFLLSGFMYSISNMPKFIQIITHLIPARYFVAVLKGIYLKGVGVKILAWDIFYLFMFALIAIVIANKKFKKKVV